MNVYKRLQTCRTALKKLPIKESGNNKFAGYTYMELGDFLPHITDLCQEHGLCPVICFGDIATLTIFNSDKPEEQILFTSPMSTAELKGCHQIQNLGAVETYLRRYLYVTAFDIVEHDAVDATHGKTDDKKTTPQRQDKPQETTSNSAQTGVKTATEGQVKLLNTKLSKAGIPVDVFLAHYSIAQISDLPMSKVNDAIAAIEKGEMQS